MKSHTRRPMYYILPMGRRIAIVYQMTVYIVTHWYFKTMIPNTQLEIGSSRRLYWYCEMLVTCVVSLITKSDNGRCKLTVVLTHGKTFTSESSSSNDFLSGLWAGFGGVGRSRLQIGFWTMSAKSCGFAYHIHARLMNVRIGILDFGIHSLLAIDLQSRYGPLHQLWTWINLFRFIINVGSNYSGSVVCVAPTQISIYVR